MSDPDPSEGGELTNFDRLLTDAATPKLELSYVIAGHRRLAAEVREKALTPEDAARVLETTADELAAKVRQFVHDVLTATNPCTTQHPQED